MRFQTNDSLLTSNNLRGSPHSGYRGLRVSSNHPLPHISESLFPHPPLSPFPLSRISVLSTVFLTLTKVSDKYPFPLKHSLPLPGQFTVPMSLLHHHSVSPLVSHDVLATLSSNSSLCSSICFYQAVHPPGERPSISSTQHWHSKGSLLFPLL